MADTVVKRNPTAPAGFFEAEAAGLRWLADAHGARVAGVVDVASGRIELERIPEATPSADAARDFGRALGVTHRSGAPAFGSRPTGYDGPLFIGRLEQPGAAEASWGRFYARERNRQDLWMGVSGGLLVGC